MPQRFDAFARLHPLGATVLFFALLTVIVVVVQGLLRGWEHCFDHVGFVVPAALGAGPLMYFSYRRDDETERR